MQNVLPDFIFDGVRLFGFRINICHHKIYRTMIHFRKFYYRMMGALCLAFFFIWNILQLWHKFSFYRNSILLRCHMIVFFEALIKICCIRKMQFIHNFRYRSGCFKQESSREAAFLICELLLNLKKEYFFVKENCIKNI